jgi:hypothetical protein
VSFLVEGFVARKDLSRTVIEGGRYYSNCYFRRQSNADERASTREWLDRVTVDLDAADASDPPPRVRVGKSFRDKLGPAKRWLASQVGRPWDKVYSDLCTQFDTRTVAGRHVVHDHMLGYVRHHDQLPQHYYRFELVIDEHGMLTRPAWFGQSYRKLRERARAWSRGRFAAATSRGWWWLVKEPAGKRCFAPNACGIAKHVELGGAWYHGFVWVGVGALTEGELRQLDRLHPQLYGELVLRDPIAFRARVAVSRGRPR